MKLIVNTNSKDGSCWTFRNVDWDLLDGGTLYISGKQVMFDKHRALLSK